MTNFIRISIVGSGLAICALAPAQIIFNNFGASDAYDTGSGWTISGPSSAPGFFAQGFAFTAGITAQVATITVGMLHVADTNSYQMQLWTDSAGIPGTLLGTWSSPAGVVGTNPPPFVINVVAGPNVTAGSTYWLTATALNATFGFWGNNVTASTGPRALMQTPGGTWSNQGNSNMGAFRIAAAVPEPVSSLVLGSGLLLALARRRRA